MSYLMECARNGVLSTEIMGSYKVVFAFLSNEGENSDGNKSCRLLELDFDCRIWNVIPEVPFGTITMLLAMIIALPIFSLFKKKTSLIF